MTNKYDIFINDKRKDQPAVNYWPCSDEVYLRSFSTVPLVFLWISYGMLKGICCAFEEGLKVMRRYMLLTMTLGTDTCHKVGIKQLNVNDYEEIPKLRTRSECTAH